MAWGTHDLQRVPPHRVLLDTVVHRKSLKTVTPMARTHPFLVQLRRQCTVTLATIYLSLTQMVLQSTSLITPPLCHLFTFVNPHRANLL
jgi:hypothetical protein